MRLNLHGALICGRSGGFHTTELLHGPHFVAGSASTYLPLWPVVFGKDRVVGVHRPVGDEHDGLAADAALSRVVELQKEEIAE